MVALICFDAIKSIIPYNATYTNVFSSKRDQIEFTQNILTKTIRQYAAFHMKCMTVWHVSINIRLV